MLGQRQRYNLDELRLWMATCGCPKPVIHWSSDFNARTCQNCGVLLTAEDMNVQEPQLDQTFVHLRVHTHLSFLKATCKPEDLIKKAKEYGMPALAKTEFGNMCGAPSFVRDCQRADIKPILGVEFNVRFGQMIYPITFIALNREGYKQLVKMTTTAWCERKNKSLGVHILDSDIPSTIHLIALVDVGLDFNQVNQALHILKSRMETYLEVNTTSQSVVTFAAQISSQSELPVVVTGNVLYTEETDKVAYGIALKIGKHVIDYQLPDHIDNWFKPSVFYGTFFEHYQPWVENAVAIANRVEDYGLVNKEFIVPTFKDGTKEYTDLSEVHRKLEVESWRGLFEKNKSGDQAYVERLQYELSVMKEKDFSSYFLLIGEIVNWMKKQGIMVPFGRGSSVGSLVCYALDIITMDPIRWGVPFERFINSGRVDLPDIDTDISQERRPEVLSHIAEVHGKDRVAHIATYQTMALRAAIENSGRALQVPHVLNRDIRKIIPDEVSDWDSLDKGGKAEVQRTMEFKPEWLSIAQALTGTAKNLGFHAAGVVISNEPLAELVPLMPPPEEDGLVGIQYNMHDCEIMGLLKLDMLGLRNIDIIQYTLDRVKARHGINLDVYNLPSDDPSTYELISGADYVSIFQLDSTGYRRLCRQLQPRQFEHIMVLNALFRPGPLEGGMTNEFVERRHGRQELVGWHPWLDEVLSITYQVPVFQEQVMAIAKIIAGFSDVEADKYRKAIGKKDAVKFAAAQKQFKEAALVQPGLAPPVSFDGTLEAWIDNLLEKLAGYARYGWNIGHSCLKDTSLILTCDHGWIPIKDIKVGEEIWSVREDTGDLFRNRVLNVINNGIRDDIVTVSADGRSITSTLDHRYFTTKHSYVDASKLILGDSLKMIYEGTSDGDFNFGMAGITHGNEVPLGIISDNAVRYDMVQGKILVGEAKSTHTQISFNKILPSFTIESISRILRNFSSFISQKFINTFRINFNTILSELFCNSGMTNDTTIINSQYRFPDVRGNGVNFISKKTNFFDVSRKRGRSSFKWKLFDNSLATITLGMKLLNKFCVDIVRVSTSITENTVGRFFSVYGYLNLLGARSTFSNFSVVTGPAIDTCSPWNEIISGKYITTFEAKLFDDHNKYSNRWNIPVTLDKRIDSVVKDGPCEVWDLTMEQDPNYVANGFVVHNCGYGWITYITAYLETHFPQEYYASLLDAFRGNNKRLPSLLRSILGSGKCIIVPPNVNESFIDYEVGTDGNIYMGLAAVRNVGKAAPEVIQEREKGKFSSFINFCQRLPAVNKTAKVNLVKAGAFNWDKMLCDRDKIDNVDIIQKWAKKRTKKFDGSRASPLEIAMKLEGVAGYDYTELERTTNERDALNSFITGHPAAIYHRLSPYLERGNTRVLTPSSISIEECQVGDAVLVVGMIDYLRKKQTREDLIRKRPSRPYLNLNVSDSTGSIITNVWWPLCEDLQKILVAGEIAMFECIVKPDKFRDDAIMLKVNNAINLSNGLPVQGVFRSNGYDPGEVVTRIGGVVNNINILGPRKYASIRGRITVPPHLLDDAVKELGEDISYLISMEAIDND